MKKHLLLLFAAFLLQGDSMRSQGMPVYDNTNFISLAKQLIESAKQTSQLLKTVEFLNQQKENLEKVSGVIKQLKSIEKFTKNHQKLVSMVRNDLKEILNSPFIKPEEVTRISNSFDLMIQTSLDDLAFIDQVLSSDFLKMTDTERMLMLKEKEAASRAMVDDLDHRVKRYRELLDFRRLQDKVNNRTSEY